MNELICAHCSRPFRARKGAQYCKYKGSSCRVAGWRAKNRPERVLATHLLALRRAAGLPALVQDPQLDQLARDAAAIGEEAYGRLLALVMVEDSVKPSALQSPKLLQADLSHFGAALRPVGAGCFHLTLVLARHRATLTDAAREGVGAGG